MKCLQCGADLLDSATFCPRCGTPTRATSFSYLPAGVPPWPTTVPQSAPYAPTALIEVPQSGDASTTRSVPKPRRSIGSIFVNIALLILSVVIGVGATLGILAANGQLSSAPATAPRAIHLPSAAPSPTAGTPAATPATTPQGNQLPTPTSFQLVTIAAVGISLKYPADWVQDQPQSTTSGNTSVDFHPQQQIPIRFLVGRLSAQNSASVTSADEINRVNLQSYSSDSNLHNYQEVQPASQNPTVGGIQWIERDAMFANSNNDVFHLVIMSVKHNNLYYSISYFAPSVVYDEAMQKYYSQMLSSFQFTA